MPNDCYQCVYIAHGKGPGTGRPALLATVLMWQRRLGGKKRIRLTNLVTELIEIQKVTQTAGHHAFRVVLRSERRHSNTDPLSGGIKKTFESVRENMSASFD